MARGPQQARIMPGHRHHAAYWAFVVHRVSGLALALFLPLHFVTLGLALEGAAVLDAALRWTDHPLLKAGEAALVILLAAHLAGGIRLLALEFLGWTPAQHTRIALGFGFAFAAGLAFLLNLAA